MTTMAGLILVLGLTRPIADDPEATRVKGVVTKFHTLPVRDRFDYLRQLKVKRDVAGLTEIARSSDESFSEHAAGYAVECLPVNRVIPYIKQFRAGSIAWEKALYSTRRCPKEVVLPYVKAVISQVKDARARICCYHLCEERGWDDLAADARADLTDERVITVPNIGPEIVGEVARDYLKSLPKSPRP
jgi:hypothetical protein